jgi:PhnB protein
MILNPYVNDHGNWAEAFRDYERHLGGQITALMLHDQVPGGSQLPEGWKDRVLHARITIGGTEVFGADIPDAQPMRSAYLSLTVDSVEEAERLYAALRDGGETFMPMEETFFATRFAMLRDRFGASWMIMHPKPLG